MSAMATKATCAVQTCMTWPNALPSPRMLPSFVASPRDDEFDDDDDDDKNASASSAGRETLAAAGASHGAQDYPGVNTITSCDTDVPANRTASPHRDPTAPVLSTLADCPAPPPPQRRSGCGEDAPLHTPVASDRCASPLDRHDDKGGNDDDEENESRLALPKAARAAPGDDHDDVLLSDLSDDGGAEGNLSRHDSMGAASVQSQRERPAAHHTTFASVESADPCDGMARVNQYLLLEPLGAGAQGEVRLAEDTQLLEQRAVKIVRRPKGAVVDDGGTVGRGDSRRMGIAAARHRQAMALQREVAALRKCRHKNIVALYEVIDDPDQNCMYLVMQYVDRGPIAKMTPSGETSRGALDCVTVTRYARQLCAGLQYLHDKGIVHRDIKPDNVLVDSDGAVFLSDFGMAELFDRSHATVAGTRGTVPFMAPELLRDECGAGDDDGAVDGKALDVWALGVTFYVLLFGKMPWSLDGSRRELTNQIVGTDVKVPRPPVVYPPGMCGPERDAFDESFACSPVLGTASEEALTHPGFHEDSLVVGLLADADASPLPGAPRLSSLADARRPLAFAERTSALDTVVPAGGGGGGESNVLGIAGFVPQTKPRDSPEDPASASQSKSATPLCLVSALDCTATVDAAGECDDGDGRRAADVVKSGRPAPAAAVVYAPRGSLQAQQRPSAGPSECAPLTRQLFATAATATSASTRDIAARWQRLLQRMLSRDPATRPTIAEVRTLCRRIAKRAATASDFAAQSMIETPCESPSWSRAF